MTDEGRRQAEQRERFLRATGAELAKLQAILEPYEAHRRHELRVMLATLAALALFALPFWAAVAFGAPAPKAKPPLAAADLVGPWRQTWYGTTEAALYRADGTCSYYWQNEHWEGTWRLCGTALELRTWRATDPPDAPNVATNYRYEVARTGKGLEGGPWRVER